jgi:hypothetical protein
MAAAVHALPCWACVHVTPGSNLRPGAFLRLARASIG